MVAGRKHIQIHPDSELGLVLRDAAAAGEPILVEAGDNLFELDVHPAAREQPSVKTPPSPEQVARSIAGIRNAAGGWKDLVGTDELIAYICERRRIVGKRYE